ncbi:MAG: acyl dehydratase [Candidatus Poriferisodalaceae bacterium]|jgi:acyl dehydratase
MTVTTFDDVELGDDLPSEQADVSMTQVKKFCVAAKHDFERFTDHDKARAEGFAGAIVPGIMSQGLLTAMIHRWAPGATITNIDTVFRGILLVDSQVTVSGAVTDVDDDSRVAEIDLTIVGEDGRTGVIGTALVAFPA